MVNKNFGNDVLTVWKLLISIFPFNNWPKQKNAIAIRWSFLEEIFNVLLSLYIWITKYC